MITLLISIAALVLGYIFYGRFVQKVYGPDAYKTTPAYSKTDGVDYVAMPTWKVVMIQFLNIAGTGPIFGAIMGALYGPSCYLWIVFGCIFGGAVHDYFSGMLSIRHGGDSLPNIVGHYLGGRVRKLMLFFALLMLLLVSVVFTMGPALIIGDLVDPDESWDAVFHIKYAAVFFFIVLIFLYYVSATLVPIDKIIGRIYPLFAISMIFMAIALFICLLVKWPALPEVWDGLQNRRPELGPVFPGLFIAVACGAVSGFHATQSPIMARCLKKETDGRVVFYGSMILEGVIALIWASVASYVFFCGGNEEIGIGGETAAPIVVNAISRNWLGVAGGILAILGVVAAPITSGDTSLRSARLIVADALNLNQKTIGNRLKISLPIFAVTFVLLCVNITYEDGFNMVWRYFSCANQILSVFTLWTITAFLLHTYRNAYYLISFIPACFMTAVCLSFVFTSKICLNLPVSIIPYVATAAVAISLVLLHILKPKKQIDNGL